MATKRTARAAKKKGPEVTTRKFYAGDGHVNVQYPLRTGSIKVQSILDKFPPGRTTLRVISVELGKVGAAFVPWSDGLPGNHGLYFK